MIVAPRTCSTSHRIGSGWKCSRASAISSRSKPIIRPTATAASAAVRWWRPQTGTPNGVPRACGEFDDVTTRNVSRPAAEWTSRA